MFPLAIENALLNIVCIGLGYAICYAFHPRNLLR